MCVGWHVYFSFRLFQEKSAFMIWQDRSAQSTSEDGELVTKQNDSQPSLWYSTHLWMARPLAMFCFIFVHWFSCLVVYAIILITFPVSPGWVCGVDYLTPGILFIYLVEITIIAIIMIIKFRAINDMRDGLAMRFEIRLHIATWATCFFIWVIIWLFTGLLFVFP
jgi:hypothetical protein